MYTLAVRRSFNASHALIGGDWGRENLPHAHRYLLELRLEGHELDRHGFLVDIVDVEAHLAALLDRYRDQFLNEFPEFSEINPSLENFAHILGTECAARLKAQPLTGIEVVLWEDDVAWVEYKAQ